MVRCATRTDGRMAGGWMDGRPNGWEVILQSHAHTEETWWLAGVEDVDVLGDVLCVA